MIDRRHTDRVMRVRNLRDFFRTSIEDVAARQRVSIEPDAAHYVVNMLTLFSRSEDLYEDNGEYFGLRPLALMLADASSASSAVERNQLLQRIGDVALFISGFFADSFARRAVDIDYYINMGGNAYGTLSDEVVGTFRGNAFAPVYRELACKFQTLVDVLNEISEGPTENTDVIRTYEIWRRTGSKRAAELLQRQGVVPIGKPRRH
ncbi:MAG: hypothetical protein QNJ14_11145 [Woeseiaceae bacterium]|nr:hypothetical protein [Woeseiaceae bacterium]